MLSDSPPGAETIFFSSPCLTQLTDNTDEKHWAVTQWVLFISFVNKYNISLFPVYWHFSFSLEICNIMNCACNLFCTSPQNSLMHLISHLIQNFYNFHTSALPFAWTSCLSSFTKSPSVASID